MLTKNWFTRLTCKNFSLVWSAVSFEIPDVPKIPDGNLSAPASHTLMLVKEKVCKSDSSSSSVTSTSSWKHPPLSKMNRYCSDSAALCCHAATGCKYFWWSVAVLRPQRSLSGQRQLQAGEIQLLQSQRHHHMGQPCNRASGSIQWQQSQQPRDLQHIRCKPQPASSS